MWAADKGAPLSAWPLRKNGHKKKLMFGVSRTRRCRGRLAKARSCRECSGRRWTGTLADIYIRTAVSSLKWRHLIFFSC
jgi:hypothetical protein